MGGTLVVAETRQGAVRDSTFELIGAARQIKQQVGGPLVVAIIDPDPAAHAAALACDGVDEVLAVTSPTAGFEAHIAQRALEGLIAAERPHLVLAAHSIDALGFTPATAAAAGLGFATDVIGVSWEDGGPVVRRGAYGGKLVAECDFPAKQCTLLLLRPATFAPAGPGAGDAPVRDVDVALDDAAQTTHLGYQEPQADGVDIATADVLLSIGRGVEDQDDVERFVSLAERMGATLSASRPLVDAGWLPAARQVGQSGQTVKPRVYLALGISGAVQHLAGMRTAETIVAVNTDPEAPIFGVAHYGAVMDLFELADELERALG
ncbi:MAG: electron transfer flavoprotein subunit alpha/FixB family protein [Solirubrobacteraceae bacterium]